MEQFVDRSEAKRADIAKAEKSLAALMASQAAGKSSCTQVVSDHETSVKVFEELKAWTEATQVLQSETSGDDRQTYSLFQENSSAAVQTSTDFKGFDVRTAVKQLAEQEHFATLAQLRSRTSAITKFGADADDDPFVKVKDLITDFSRSQADASPETSQKSHCDEEASKATEMKEDLGAEVAKHSSELWSVVYKNAVDSRRTAWRVITSIEQKEKSKSEEQLASYAREYIAKVESELQKIREGVLALMDKKLVPSPSTDESKAFYYKMKSDYYRYLAEFATDKTRSKAGEDACVACAEATKIAENDLGLSSVVAQRQIPIDQTIEIPAVSLAENVVEMPVIQTEEKTQGVNTHAQHVVNIVEVERPKIIDETVQKPVMQKKINQVTKHIKIPQVQFLDKADNMLVDVQRQILPMALTVQKTTEIPQLQFPDQAVDAPVVVQRQVPQVHVVKKTVEISQLQAVEKIVETRETQTIQGVQTSESLNNDPDAKIKFYTEEALHGVGGLIFDTHGNRVASELGGRNCVTGEMRKNEPSFSLALNKATSDDIAWQRKQYTARGVRKLHESGTTLTEGMEAPVSKMSDSIEAHCQASLKTARNPNGEPYTAFTSDKSWDEAPGKTVAHRQVPLIQRVQRTVEVPRVQFIDRLVDDPDCTKKRRKAEGQDQDVDVERFSDLVLPSSQSCLCVSIASSDGEEEELKQQAEGTSLVQGGEHRCEEDETNAQVPESELVQVAPNMGAGGSHPQAMMDQERDKELREIRRMVEFLVHRERKLDVRTDVAARRLERLERESSQLEDEERETSLEGALTDRTKVVKLIVDKWFVDKGYGFGKAPSGEVVVIHASAVHGAEVLVVGTEAWTQVVSDHARAEGGYRARKAWGQRAWKEEKDRERVSRAAQQVRRAAALTAELAAQSESKVFEVCSHPPGLSEEALVTASPHLVNDSPPCSPPPLGVRETPASTLPVNNKPLQGARVSHLAGSFRASRPRSSTRAQDNAAVLEETLRLFVEATGKDEASMRQQLVSKRSVELLRDREFWRTRVEEKRRFQVKKKEAWEFFRRMPSFKPKSQFKWKVMTGYYSGSTEGREKYLDEWTIELQKKALEEDSRLEARERAKMGKEDSVSRRRTEWERIIDRSPFLKAAS